MEAAPVGSSVAVASAEDRRREARSPRHTQRGRARARPRDAPTDPTRSGGRWGATPGPVTCSPHLVTTGALGTSVVTGSPGWPPYFLGRASKFSSACVDHRAPRRAPLAPPSRPTRVLAFRPYPLGPPGVQVAPRRRRLPGNGHCSSDLGLMIVVVAGWVCHGSVIGGAMVRRSTAFGGGHDLPDEPRGDERNESGGRMR